MRAQLAGLLRWAADRVDGPRFCPHLKSAAQAIFFDPHCEGCGRIFCEDCAPESQPYSGVDMCVKCAAEARRDDPDLRAASS